MKCVTFLSQKRLLKCLLDNIFNLIREYTNQYIQKDKTKLAVKSITPMNKSQSLKRALYRFRHFRVFRYRNSERFLHEFFDEKNINKMGQQCSHMNSWALACIIRADSEHLDELLALYEKLPKNSRLADYEIDQSTFLDLLEQLQIHPSDREVFEDFFKILDMRNRRIVNIVELLIALTPLTINSTKKLFERAFWLYDRKQKMMIDKPEILSIMKILNNSFESMGDKPLSTDIMYDLVNSIYTSAGRIDGEIYYPDFIEYMTIHPIIELFISPQYQGTLLMKIQQQELEEKAEEEHRQKELEEKRKRDMILTMGK